MKQESSIASRSWRRRYRLLLFASLLATGVVGAFIARPVWLLWRAAQHDSDRVEAPPAGYANDASRLNLIAVRDVREVPADPSKAESELAALLKEASAQG